MAYQFSYQFSYKRNTAYLLTTGLDSGTGAIGAGQLFRRDTGAVLDNTQVIVKASATDSGGTTILAATNATYISSGSVGARWDYLMAASYFDGSHGTVKAKLQVFALDGVTELGEYLWVCSDSGQ